MSGELGQGILQAVVDLREQPGAEFDGEQLAAEFDLVADLDAGGAFEDLDIGFAATHADDLALEAVVAIGEDEGDFVLGDAVIEGHADHVAIDASYFAG